jgi:hypothetical protein
MRLLPKTKPWEYNKKTLKKEVKHLVLQNYRHTGICKLGAPKSESYALAHGVKGHEAHHTLYLEELYKQQHSVLDAYHSLSVPFQVCLVIKTLMQAYICDADCKT